LSLCSLSDCSEDSEESSSLFCESRLNFASSLSDLIDKIKEESRLFCESSCLFSSSLCRLASSLSDLIDKIKESILCISFFSLFTCTSIELYECNS